MPTASWLTVAASRIARHWVLVCGSIAVLLLAAGCGNPDRARIVGTWELSSKDPSLDRAKLDPVDEALPPSDQDTIVEPLSPRMVVHFYSSGTLETETRISKTKTQKSGVWRFVSYDESNGTMLISCDLMGQTTEHQVRFESDGRIKMVPPNMAGTTRKLFFVRQ